MVAVSNALNYEKDSKEEFTQHEGKKIEKGSHHVKFGHCTVEHG